MNITNVKDTEIVIIEIEKFKDSDLAIREIRSLAKGVKVVIDVTQIQFANSAFLRNLLSMYRLLNVKQAKFVLVGLSDNLRDTMKVTGFLDFFEVQDSPEDAVNLLK